MARLVTAGSTSNYLSCANLGSLLNGAAIVSVHAWVQMDAFNATGANDDRVVTISNGTNTSLMFGFDGTASNRVRVAGRSVSSDGFQAVNGTTTTNTTGVWYSIGGVFNYAGDIIRVYLNGVQEASTAVTFGNASYTDAGTSVSGFMVNSTPPTVTNNLMDGKIAEVSLWVGDIATAGFEQLADRFSGLMVRPDLLVYYNSFLGKFSPEIDKVSGRTVTINGTVDAFPHPRIIYPSNYNIAPFNAAALSSIPNKIRQLNQAINRAGTY